MPLGAQAVYKYIAGQWSPVGYAQLALAATKFAAVAAAATTTTTIFAKLVGLTIELPKP